MHCVIFEARETAVNGSSMMNCRVRTLFETTRIDVKAPIEGGDTPPASKGSAQGCDEADNLRSLSTGELYDEYKSDDNRNNE